MSFLRSVIADARPRKSMLEPSDSPSAISGWKTGGLDGDASATEEKSPNAAGQTSRPSTLLPIREGASDFDIGDAPAFQADHPVNQDIQDMASNVEPDSPLSVMVDKSRPISDEESHARLDTGDLPGREPDSEGDKASKAEGNMTSQPSGTVIPDSRMNLPEVKDHDASIASPETRGAQNRAPDHEETEPVSSPASIRDTPGKELTDFDDNSALQAEEGTGQLGVQEMMSSPAQGEVVGVTATDDRHHPESSTKGPVSGQALAPDNSAGRNEAEKALADSGVALQLSPSVDKRADKKSLASQEEISRLQKPDEAKGVLHDVQLVSRQAIPMDSHISSDLELASVPQPAERKVSTSASSPGSGSSKPGSPAQHIARPAKPSASRDALRSVPARPFQTDLIPKDGHSFHSRAPLRYPEKKHEAPKVQIGQIDVIIEAPAQPATQPAPPPSPIDLASRHYLRRL